MSATGQLTDTLNPSNTSEHSNRTEFALDFLVSHKIYTTTIYYMFTFNTPHLEKPQKVLVCVTIQTHWKNFGTNVTSDSRFPAFKTSSLHRHTLKCVSGVGCWLWVPWRPGQAKVMPLQLPYKCWNSTGQ